MSVFTIPTRAGIADPGQGPVLARLAEELRHPGARLLLHLHGGLVDEAAGRATAARLSGTGAHSWNCGDDWTQVYPVWRTGAFEELKQQWRELAHDDELYQAIVRKLIGFVARRLVLPAVEARGVAPIALDEDEIHRRITGQADERRPFEDVDEPLDAVAPAGAPRASLWATADDGMLVIDFEDELRSEVLSV